MTAICVECGHFELYYVLACGDSQVGESQVLLFAGEELKALQQEIRTVDQAFGKLDTAKAEGEPDDVVEAQDHLAKMLKTYIAPNSFLPEKHLVQAYSVNAKRWTRIRSDKMRNHWRSYKVHKSLLDAKEAGQGLKQLDRAALSKAFRDVSKKVRDDIKSGITYKAQVAKGSVSGSITDVWDANWLKWVDAVNDSLTYSGSSAHHDLSAGAQLLRGYAGYGVTLGYDPKKNSYGLTGTAEARAILAEAKATFDGYIPHRDGWHALINFSSETASQAGQQNSLDFGYFRGKVTIGVTAMLGASIFGTAGIEYSPGPNGSVLAKPSMAGAKGQVSAGAFAGVEAGGSVTGALEWQNPGWRKDENGPVQNAKWAAIISIGVSGAANAGIGAEVDFMITFENGKFMFRCKAQVVIGIGAKGGLTGTVGFGTMYDFIMYVYHQLKDNNYAILKHISKEAFDAIVKIVMYAVEFGVEAIRHVEARIDQIIATAMAPIRAANEAEAYARKIKARPEALYFAPPEAKGAILYRLSETFTFSFEEHQEAAILVVIGTIQTQREWEQIVERITPTGSKSSAAAGMARLNWIMDGGSQRKFNQMIRFINSLPPRTRMAGEPITIRNFA